MKIQKCKRMMLFLSLGSVWVFLTGCWTNREIEELSLNVAIAMDKGVGNVIERKFDEEGNTYHKEDKMTITYQYINTSAIGKGSELQGGQGQNYINVSEIGDSNHFMIREIALRQENPIMFHHTKVIVIQDELLENHSLEELIDLYLRDNELRLSCLVLVSKGSAKGTLETKQPGEIPAFRLIGISDNEYRSSKILAPVTLAKLQGKVKSGMPYMLQTIASVDGQVKFSGAAIIDGKSNRIKGNLNEDELVSLNFILGEAEGGLLKVKNEDTFFIYEMDSISSKIVPIVKNGDISFELKVDVEGRISENWSKSNQPFKTIKKKAEEEAQKELEENLKAVIEKIQKEHKADVAGFGNQLRIKHPALWEEVKGEWDSTFSDIPIQYSVSIKIIDYGYTVSQ